MSGGFFVCFTGSMKISYACDAASVRMILLTRIERSSSNAGAGLLTLLKML